MSQNAVYNKSLRTKANGFNPPGADGRVDPNSVTRADVMNRAVILFGIVLASAAIGAILSNAFPAIGLFIWMGGMLGTIILGWIVYYMHMRDVHVGAIIGYAVAEGTFLGGVSMSWNTAYSAPNSSPFNGLVAQAVLATFATFAAMLIINGLGIVKVNSRLVYGVSIFILGYSIFSIVNFIYSVVANQPFGLGGGTKLGLAISIGATIMASISLAIEIAEVDALVAAGAPKKTAWLLAEQLIVALVWLYNEFLRLIAEYTNQNSD